MEEQSMHDYLLGRRFNSVDDLLDALITYREEIPVGLRLKAAGAALDVHGLSMEVFLDRSILVCEIVDDDFQDYEDDFDADEMGYEMTLNDIEDYS